MLVQRVLEALQLWMTNCDSLLMTNQECNQRTAVQSWLCAQEITFKAIVQTMLSDSTKRHSLTRARATQYYNKCFLLLLRSAHATATSMLLGPCDFMQWTAPELQSTRRV
jgi:hypothetical protein